MPTTPQTIALTPGQKVIFNKASHNVTLGSLLEDLSAGRITQTSISHIIVIGDEFDEDGAVTVSSTLRHDFDASGSINVDDQTIAAGAFYIGGEGFAIHDPQLSDLLKEILLVL